MDLLRIITRGSNSKCQLTIGVFSIAFVMSVIEKGVAMDTEPYPVVAGLLIRKAVTW